MIRAAGTAADGSPMLILGLDRDNTARLLDNQPIMCRPADVGLKVPGSPQVALLAGPHMESLRDDLASIGVLVPPDAREDRGVLGLAMAAPPPGLARRSIYFLAFTAAALEQLHGGRVVVLTAPLVGPLHVVALAGEDLEAVGARITAPDWHLPA